ncbi:MAG: hypothetical protein F4107_07140 [Gemmatimonadetes bacterium]|nr:hypothetical protein [Gemmatimonadota bacterium]MYD12530.1 hypothetical protein [Gemmatimonadota bacterium]MYI65695.1 hypothetical protein [Gemmatimonadota bacterium]
MNIARQLVHWDFVLQDLRKHLEKKREEARRVKEELAELHGFVNYVEHRVFLEHQIDLFPFMRYRTARQAIQAYFSIYSEPARVPDIARTLIQGGFRTSAAGAA